MFLETDWQRLHLLSLLVDVYFAEPSKELLAEIRLNEAKLGATPEDRLRLRWRLAASLAEEGRDTSSSDDPPARKRKGDPRLKRIK